MPTTILDNESYPEALQRRYAEEAKDEERMTTKLEQAARQALGALVRAEAMYGQPNADIQTALREALAEQAEQEPVGWYSHKGGFNECGEGQPLYAAPVSVQDLTDDEIETTKHCLPIYLAEITDEDLNEFARAVIAADREKNR